MTFIPPTVSPSSLQLNAADTSSRTRQVKQSRGKHSPRMYPSPVSILLLQWNHEERISCQLSFPSFKVRRFREYICPFGSPVRTVQSILVLKLLCLPFTAMGRSPSIPKTCAVRGRSVFVWHPTKNATPIWTIPFTISSIRTSRFSLTDTGSLDP